MNKYNLFHIGGREGGIGKAQHLTQLGNSLAITVFEANLGEDESSRAWIGDMQPYSDVGIEVSVIERCISDRAGRREFYINADPACSSLFKIAPNTENYSRMLTSGKQVWGEACRPTRTPIWKRLYLFIYSNSINLYLVVSSLWGTAYSMPLYFFTSELLANRILSITYSSTVIGNSLIVSSLYILHHSLVFV